MKSGIFNYGQSCYDDDEFAFAREKRSSMKDGDRIDVTFFTKARSQAEALRKITNVPPVKRMGSISWVRDRISEGCGKLSSYLTDDAVYCFDMRGTLYIGKFFVSISKSQRCIETRWIPNPNWDFDLKIYERECKDEQLERQEKVELDAKVERVTRELAVASPVITCPHCQQKVDLAIVLGGAVKLNDAFYNISAFKPRREN